MDRRRCLACDQEVLDPSSSELVCDKEDCRRLWASSSARSALRAYAGIPEWKDAPPMPMLPEPKDAIYQPKLGRLGIFLRLKSIFQKWLAAREGRL